jgi:GNAT superfamily N-acetyltransferase
VTPEGLVYRPEVLAEYGFLGTSADLIDDLRNGIQLHGAQGMSFEIWHALTPEERDGAAGGEAIRYSTPQREQEAQLVRTFQMLHRADGTVTHPPTNTFVTHALANFGYAIAVSQGRAVGYMTVCDGTDDPATWDGVYETLTNIWVAHAHRRAGVASALLEFVQEQPHVAIARLTRPFSPAGAAWAQAELPHLLAEPGRNEPCLCGSGRKYKRCCGA